MPTAGQIAGLGGTGLGTILPLVTSLSNPVSAALAAGVTLVALVDKIGQGRKAANKMTGNGGPQDILNKQLKAISGSAASAQEKAQATDKAWRGFLQAADQFAAANPKQATVVKQAIYKTPELTSTVQNLLGKDPLADEYTSMAAPGIQAGGTQPNPGPSVLGTVARAGVAAATPFITSAVRDKFGSPASVGNGSIGQQPEDNGGMGAGTLNPPPKNPAPSLLSRILPQAVSAGTSIVGGVLQSNAAGKAADAQEAAANAGAERIDATANRALDIQENAINQQQKNIQPFIDAGTGALRQVQDITNDPGYSWTQTFKPPTAEEAMADPGIQFQLAEANKALAAYERANGSLLSGKAVKDIAAYNQGIAATHYGDVFNRSLTGYNTNYNTFAGERGAKINPQLSLAGLGQTSVNQLNSDIAGNTANQASTMTSAARNVADAGNDAAAARASGYVSKANIAGTSISSIGQNILDSINMQEILRRLPSAA